MPVCEVHMESAEGVIVPDLPHVVEIVQGDGRDESQNIVSHLLGESLDVPDDSGLRQLIENVPAEFGAVLEEERSTFVVGGVKTGQFTENVDLFGQCRGLGKWQSDFDTMKECCWC